MDPLDQKDQDRIWETMMASARRHGPDPDDHLSTKIRLEREHQSILLTVNTLLRKLTAAPAVGYKIENRGWRQRLAATLREALYAAGCVIFGMIIVGYFGKAPAPAPRIEPAQPNDAIVAENKRIIGANEILIRANETLTKELAAAKNNKTISEVIGTTLQEQRLVTKISSDKVTLTIPREIAKTSGKNWAVEVEHTMTPEQFANLKIAIQNAKNISTSE